MTAEQEWALEYESLPSHFHEFSSEDYMRQLLPPQLYGAIKRMQVPKSLLPLSS